MGSEGRRELTFSNTATNRGLSAACPGVSTNVGGRQRRSAARWTLLVSPPRERPSAAALSRARWRRRSRRRSARSDSPAGESTVAGADLFQHMCRGIGDPLADGKQRRRPGQHGTRSEGARACHLPDDLPSRRNATDRTPARQR